MKHCPAVAISETNAYLPLLQMVLGVFAFWGTIALTYKMLKGAPVAKPAVTASAAPAGKSDIPNMLSPEFEVSLPLATKIIKLEHFLNVILYSLKFSLNRSHGSRPLATRKSGTTWSRSANSMLLGNPLLSPNSFVAKLIATHKIFLCTAHKKKKLLTKVKVITFYEIACMQKISLT
jgi:hypothetical protein